MSEIKIGVVIADENEFNPAVDVLKDYYIADKPLNTKPGKLFKIEACGNTALVHIVLSGIGKINTAASAALKTALTAPKRAGTAPLPTSIWA